MQYANGVAALWNAGTVVANNVVWMGNVGTVDGEGGAVHNIGSLKLINNVFTGNRAVGGGNDVRFGKEFDAAQSANFFSVVFLQPVGSIWMDAAATGSLTDGSSCADSAEMSQPECTVVNFDTSHGGIAGAVNSCSPCGRCAPDSAGRGAPGDCELCAEGKFKS